MTFTIGHVDEDIWKLQFSNIWIATGFSLVSNGIVDRIMNNFIRYLLCLNSSDLDEVQDYFLQFSTPMLVSMFSLTSTL